jgi:hypothetical protein
MHSAFRMVVCGKDQAPSSSSFSLSQGAKPSISSLALSAVIAMKSTSPLIPSADSAVISIGKSHRLPGSSNVTRALAGYRDNFAIRSAIVIAPPISGRFVPGLNLLEKSGLISTHRGQSWPRSHRPEAHRPSPKELRSTCGYRGQQKRRRSQSQSGGQCEAPPPCDRPRGGRSSVAIPEVKTTLRTLSDKSTDIPANSSLDVLFKRGDPFITNFSAARSEPRAGDSSLWPSAFLALAAALVREHS